MRVSYERRHWICNWRSIFGFIEGIPTLVVMAANDNIVDSIVIVSVNDNIASSVGLGVARQFIGLVVFDNNGITLFVLAYVFDLSFIGVMELIPVKIFDMNEFVTDKVG